MAKPETTTTLTTTPLDHHAILARAQPMVDLLRTCYVCEGWHGKGLDEPAAERQDPMGGRPRVFLRSRTIPRLDSGWQPWGHDLRCSRTLGTG